MDGARRRGVGNGLVVALFPAFWAMLVFPARVRPFTSHADWVGPLDEQSNQVTVSCAGVPAADTLGPS